MDMGWLNLGSLLLGLAALFLPAAAWRAAKAKAWTAHLLTLCSMSACMTAVLFQMRYQEYLTQIEDWSALLDTMGASVHISTALAILTVLVNAVVVVGARLQDRQ